MRKKLIFAVMAALVFGTVLSSVAFSSAIPLPLRVVVDNVQVYFPDAKPYVDKQNRTQVPMRFVAEALGAKVSWNNKTRQASFQKDSTRVVLTIGKREYEVNGQIKTMDTEAVLVDGRTFVPARYVAEALGADVEWDSAVRTVYIWTGKGPKVKDEPGVEFYDGIAFNPETDFDNRDYSVKPEKGHEFSLNLMRNIRFVKENGKYVIKGSYPALPEELEWDLRILINLKDGGYYVLGHWDPEGDNRVIQIPRTGSFNKIVPISNYSEIKEIRLTVEIRPSNKTVTNGYFRLKVVEYPEKFQEVWYHNWWTDETTYYSDEFINEVIQWR